MNVIELFPRSSSDAACDDLEGSGVEPEMLVTSPKFNGIVVLWERLQHLNAQAGEKALVFNSELSTSFGEARYLTLWYGKKLAVIEWRPETSNYAVSFLQGEVCQDEQFTDIATGCERILSVLRDGKIRQSNLREAQAAKRAAMRR